MRYENKITVRKPEREKSLESKNNGSTDYKAVGYEDFDQVHLAQVKVQFKALVIMVYLNPLNSELNSISHLLALLGAHPILHVSKIRVKLTVCWLAFQGAFCHMKLYSSIQIAQLILCILFCKSVKWNTCLWLVSDQRAWSKLRGLTCSLYVMWGHPWSLVYQGATSKKRNDPLSHSLSLYMYKFTVVDTINLLAAYDEIYQSFCAFLLCCTEAVSYTYCS